jgi:hypothetical protein
MQEVMCCKMVQRFMAYIAAWPPSGTRQTYFERLSDTLIPQAKDIQQIAFVFWLLFTKGRRRRFAQGE